MFRIFGGDRIKSMMSMFQIDDLPIESGLLVRSHASVSRAAPSALQAYVDFLPSACPQHCRWETQHSMGERARNLFTDAFLPSRQPCPHSVLHNSSPLSAPALSLIAPPILSFQRHMSSQAPKGTALNGALMH